MLIFQPSSPVSVTRSHPLSLSPQAQAEVWWDTVMGCQIGRQIGHQFSCGMFRSLALAVVTGSGRSQQRGGGLLAIAVVHQSQQVPCLGRTFPQVEEARCPWWEGAVGAALSHCEGGQPSAASHRLLLPTCHSPSRAVRDLQQLRPPLSS